MSYIPALFLVVGVAGAVLHYLLTGSRPEDVNDIFLPGGYVLPSYVKDIFHFAHEPGRTIKNKVHPLNSAILDVANNEDYRRRPIRNPRHPIRYQLQDLAEYLAEQYLPIAWRQWVEEKHPDWQHKYLPFIGITEAPRAVRDDK